jgi:hypothetical protein
MPITTNRQLASVWTVWGSNPGGVETSRTRPDSLPRPAQAPVQWTPVSFPGGQGAGEWL